MKTMNTKKLWILFFDFDYEGDDVIAVYETEEEAKYAKENIKHFGYAVESGRMFIREVTIGEIVNKDAYSL
jgi:hypothetical protein